MDDFVISKSKSKYRKAKKKLVLFNTIVSVVLAVSIFTTGIAGLASYMMGDMRRVEIPNDHDSIGITEEAMQLPKDIINIALFGLDSYSKKTTNLTQALSGRSDTMIVVSINTIDNTIKMTSILRDSWVPMLDRKGNPTHNKINASYSFGGAQNAIRTINTNFGLNITDYVTVNMHQVANIIDIMGGLDIEITEMERQRINHLANHDGFNAGYVNKTGLVHLNGVQAMSYSRIRNDSEETRVLRQQKVIGMLFEKAKALSVSEYPTVLNTMLSTIETSLSYDEIFKFAPMLKITSLHLQSTSVPGKEVVAQGGVFEDTNGGWVWKYDINDAKKHIHKWIYGV